MAQWQEVQGGTSDVAKLIADGCTIAGGEPVDRECCGQWTLGLAVACNKIDALRHDCCTCTALLLAPKMLLWCAKRWWS